MITTILKKKRPRISAIAQQFGRADGNNQLMSFAPVAKQSKTEQASQPLNVSLTERLNRMIAAGASFDVGANDFQMCGAECLTDSEKQFLAANKPAVLCTLQQALLMKYLSLDDLRMFKDEINERTAILSDGANISPPFEIVAEVSREWFADLLDEIKEK